MAQPSELQASINRLMTAFDAIDILETLAQWHESRAKQAPPQQARKLRSNALAIQRASGDVWPMRLGRIDEETEQRWN